MNSLYGVQIRKDINESYKCKFEHSLRTEYDNNVLDDWKFSNGNYIVKIETDDRLDADDDINNILPSHLGAFILSDSKRIMINFIRELNGFYNNVVFYGDTDCSFIEKNTGTFWPKIV